MTLTEIKSILATYNIQPSKALGQNFLHDNNQLRKIITFAQIKDSDNVIEVGPGLGSLTELLIKSAGKVLAIEKDDMFAEILKERFGEAHNLTILCDDALEYFRRIDDLSGWILVSNLPYSVASPMLIELAKKRKALERMVVTVQFEVAQRLVATEKDDAYGALTLIVQLRYKPDGFFKIPASCFYPQPKVDSACVRFVKRSTPLLDENLEPVFYKIVNRAFSQRRKMMFKLLKADWREEKLTEAFNKCSIDLKARAEVVSLEQFILLTRTLAHTD